MWQVLVAAAAAAGSGILAKKFISPNDTQTKTLISDCNPKCAESAETKSSPPQDTFKESSTQGKRETLGHDSTIFRFSCPEKISKEFRKNTRNGIEWLKKNGGSKRGKKNVAAEGGRKELLADQVGNGSGKRISICLKKRRTGKHAAGKCESRVSKDNSFGWGVGVGIMYMMSAGTAEISRLNSAMDETVKTVQELKAEISRKKNLHKEAENEAEINKKFAERRSYNDPLFTRVRAKSKDNIKAFCPTMTEEEGYASSILTDNQQPEVLEMHQLEAELESELQKLPWCAMEGSSSEGRTDIFEAEVLAEGQPSEDFENATSYEHNGVLPAELDQKLCHLLVEQQGSQIMELETELHHAHSKLHQKEAELQALKDCVKRLTEFSLANASDEETEDQGEDVKAISDGIEEKLGWECRKSMVGMKRSIDCENEPYI
ncbi:hypothetical protein C2S53_002315 [Perilla frutescens var. hirtella]|uniref:Uncharacterized protein n=1 Tax=Perilla frutescens var. hirtella TaxID=608512 RepID=A0AAD4J222_PERFH|nr:hypothetical protein C2S53_002315 [Perilla frutescens var. hirtella]